MKAAEKQTVFPHCSCLPRSVVAPSLGDTAYYSRLNIQLSPTNKKSEKAAMSIFLANASAQLTATVVSKMTRQSMVAVFGAFQSNSLLQAREHWETSLLILIIH